MNETYRTDSDTRGAYPDARRDMMKPLPCSFDAIDAEAAENPIIDHMPQRGRARKSDRLFRILDNLQQGGSK